MGVAEQALEAHNVHLPELAHIVAVVPLHHVIFGAGGQQAQPLNPGRGVAVDGIAQNVQRVAGGQKQLSRVDPLRDSVPIGPQRVRRQLQALLRGGAHEHQRHVPVQKGGPGLQVGLHDLQLRAAPLQIVDVLQVTVEVAHLRE